MNIRDFTMLFTGFIFGVGIYYFYLVVLMITPIERVICPAIP